MTMFGKKGLDTVDYTLLQKKGFIKKKEEKELPYKINPDGTLDFTSQATNVQVADSLNSTSISSENSSAMASNPFGFLGGFEQSSSNVISNTTTNSGIATSTSQLSADNAELNSLKIKIDDFEYKLSQLMDKLALIESKLNGFERKVLE